MDSPIKETLWTHCLYEVYSESKVNGSPTVEFSDVDAKVLEAAKSLTLKELFEKYSPQSPNK